MSRHFTLDELPALPERSPEGMAYLYCMEFDSGVIKVGFTRDPKARVRTHVTAANVWTGSQLTEGWLSVPHSNYEDNEYALVAFGERAAIEVRGREHLVGLKLEQVLEVAEGLDYVQTAQGRTGKRPFTVSEGWMPRKHGTPSSYKRGCRCRPCTAANTARQTRGGYARQNQKKRLEEREMVDGRLVHPNPYGGHGSVTAYTGCGCRCDECRAGMRKYRARKIRVSADEVERLRQEGERNG